MSSLTKGLFFLLVAVTGLFVAQAQDYSDFRSATSTESCSYILLHLVTNKGEITCYEIFDWARCYVRFSGLDKRAPNDEDVKKFGKELKANLDLLSLACDIQLQTVIRALEKPEGVRQKVYAPSVYIPTQPDNQTTQQVYKPSQPTYTSSQPVYNPTNPAYDQPSNKPEFAGPSQPVYTPSQPTYNSPKPVYSQPSSQPKYTEPRQPVYNPNNQVYSQPSNQPEYTDPSQPVYSPIQQTNNPSQKVYEPSQPVYSEANAVVPSLYSQSQGCLLNTADACANRPDGDYPACSPLCEKGVYITCTNQLTIIRSCALGWFKIPNTSPLVGRFTAPLVYNPDTYSCLQASPSCPRDLDYQLETGK